MRQLSVFLLLSLFSVFTYSQPITKAELDETFKRSITCELANLVINNNCDINLPNSSSYFKLIDLIQDTDARFIGDAAGFWGIQGRKVGNCFFDDISRIYTDIITGHPNPDKVIVQATMLEIVSNDIIDPNYVIDPDYPMIASSNPYTIEIPVDVWEEFSSIPYGSVPRYFDYRRMVYTQSFYNAHSNYQYGNAFSPYGYSPDYGQLETKMWRYFIGQKYIDIGFRSFHWGTYYKYTVTPNIEEELYNLLSSLRDYASTKTVQPFVINSIDGNGACYNGKLLFDVHHKPIRFSEMGHEPFEGEHQTIVLPDHINGIYGRSAKGITEYGLDYSESGAPYLVSIDFLDITEPSLVGTHTPGIGSAEIFGWDELRWIIELDRDYRKKWMEHTYCRVNKIDGIGYFQMRVSQPTKRYPVNGTPYNYEFTLTNGCPSNCEYWDLKDIWDNYNSEICCPTAYVSSDPIQYYDAQRTTGRIVSGDFDGDNKENDIAAFFNFNYGDGNYARADVWISDEQSPNGKFDFRPGWWSEKDFDTNQIIDRVVSGDFDGDGVDEVAAFYITPDDGGAEILVWSPEGHPALFVSFNKEKWWDANWYTPIKLGDRIVSGDFNGNGKDEIAAFHFDEDGTDIHVWSYAGNNSFQYEGSQWYSQTYDARQLNGRIVSGDFDLDGKDDIAGFYERLDPKQEGSITELHYWTLSSTIPNFFLFVDDLWVKNWYSASRIADRVVAGDIDGDDKAEISALHVYNNGATKIHRWKLTTLLEPYYWNNIFGQNPCQGCVEYLNDLWAPIWPYSAEGVTDRVMCLDINNDALYDIAALYDYGPTYSKMHTWRSDGRFMHYLNNWWDSTCPWKGHNTLHFIEGDCNIMVVDDSGDIQLRESNKDNGSGITGLSLKITPTPAQEQIKIVYEIKIESKIKLGIYDLSGNNLMSLKQGEYQLPGTHVQYVDLAHLSSGFYICVIETENDKQVHKIIKI